MTSKERESRPATTRLVERNIAELLARRHAEEQQLGWQDRLAELATRFTGSMAFVWLHLAICAIWVAINLDWIPGLRPFDPTFVFLATAASVEAIFLSTFVLITQNRMQVQADKRADLNLQIDLLAEHEITQLVKMVAEMARAMNVPSAQEPDLKELEKDVRPEEVLEALSAHEQKLRAKPKSELANSIKKEHDQ